MARDLDNSGSWRAATGATWTVKERLQLGILSGLIAGLLTDIVSWFGVLGTDRHRDPLYLLASLILWLAIAGGVALVPRKVHSRITASHRRERERHRRRRQRRRDQKEQSGLYRNAS